MFPLRLPVLHRDLLAIAAARNVVACCTAAGLLAATVYNFGARPLYQTRAGLSLRESREFGPPSYDTSAQAEAFNRQVMTLKSRELAARVLERAGGPLEAELNTGRMGGAASRFLQEAWRALGLESRARPSAVERVEAFRSRLGVETDPLSRTWVYVAFSAYDPQAAAHAANALADEYLLVLREENARAREEGRARLQGELHKREQSLGRKLSDLSAARQGSPAVSRALLEQQVKAFEGALVAARMRRLSAETRYREAEASTTDSQATRSVLMASQETRSRQEALEAADRQVDALAALYGEKHPELMAARERAATARQARDEALAGVRTSLESDLRLAQAEEQRLERAGVAARRELDRVKSEGLPLEVREQVTEADKLALNDLIRTPAAGVPVLLDATIVQRAEVPLDPASPQVVRNYLYALAGSLGAALLLIWLETSNDTLRTPEEVKAQLGLSCLGMIPSVRGLQAAAVPGAVQESSSPLADGARLVRSNLVFLLGEDERHVIVVTSPSPGEGKSTFATMLAVVLARSGARVLMVDADLRKPMLHRTMAVPQGPGLSEVLRAGQASWRDAVKRTDDQNLDVLPSGQALSQPSESLMSSAMRDLVDVARSEYRWVVIDAPPALGMPDASILAELATGAIVVGVSSRSRVGAVSAVVEQLGRARARVLGMVLNRVDFDRQSYYYGNYYAGRYEGYRAAALARDGEASAPPPS